jgi:hypothetical protein
VEQSRASQPGAGGLVVAARGENFFFFLLRLVLIQHLMALTAHLENQRSMDSQGWQKENEVMNVFKKD